MTDNNKEMTESSQEPSIIDLKNLSFEEAMSKLEHCVKTLEDGGLSLDAAVRLFEEGNILQNYCSQKLAEVKLRIEKVISSEEDKAPVLEEVQAH